MALHIETPLLNSRALSLHSDRAIWLGDGHPKSGYKPLEDMPRTVARVRALFSGWRSPD